MKEIYISTDIETDGPIPGEYSMLSFGSAAFSQDKQIVSTFSVNLETLKNAKQDPGTMKWWKTQKKAWAACRCNLQGPLKAMKDYVKWLKNLSGKPVFVAYPASFDFTFIYWYLMKFIDKSPFSYVAVDIKTYAFAMMKKPFYTITKSKMPKRWFDESKKSHIALDDAIEQGKLFCNMFLENTK